MDNSKLKVLMRAVKLGSLRRAADELGYSQPALSLMMDSLETEVGVPLMKRSRSGVELSEEGKMLLPYINALLNSETAFWQKVSTINSVEKISISSFTSSSETWLPGVLRKFREKHPDIEIELYLGVRRQLDWIERNVVEFGIMDTQLGANLETIKLHEDYYKAMVPMSFSEPEDGSPIDIKELVREYPLLKTRKDPNCALNQFIEQNQCKQLITIDSASFETMRRAVSEETAVAFLSCSSFYDIHGVKILETNPKLTRTLCIAAKSIDALSPLAKDLIHDMQMFWDSHGRQHENKHNKKG